MSRDITREITVYTGKKRPKKDRPAAPIVREKAPGTPTPERAAKETEEFATAEVVPGNVYQEPHVQHKVQLAVDAYRRHFNQNELEAAERFVRDVHAAMSQVVTANYDGGTRSLPGPRTGGVAEHLRDSFNRLKRVLDVLTPGDKKALMALVVGVRSELTGRTTSIHDIARDRGATHAAQRDLANVGVGILKAALEHAHEAYRLVHLNSRSSRKLTATEESNRAKVLKGPRS